MSRWNSRPEDSVITPAQWLDGRAAEIRDEIYDLQREAQATGNPPFTPIGAGAVQAVLGEDDD